MGTKADDNWGKHKGRQGWAVFVRGMFRSGFDLEVLNKKKRREGVPKSREERAGCGCSSCIAAICFVVFCLLRRVKKAEGHTEEANSREGGGQLCSENALLHLVLHILLCPVLVFRRIQEAAGEKREGQTGCDGY